MAELAFDCIGVQADRFAAGPTLLFRLRICETSGERVHAIALRCQLRIEPAKRRYTAAEAARLDDLFGDPSRWADTQRPLQFAMASVMVPGFTGSTEVDVVVPCTYDLEIASTNYFNGLLDGDIPFLLLFSGSVFERGETGFSVSPVPWHKETTCQVPVAEWRSMMDGFFPNSGWLRLDRDTLAELGAFKNARALPTWEQAVQALLAEVREGVRP